MRHYRDNFGQASRWQRAHLGLRVGPTTTGLALVMLALVACGGPQSGTDPHDAKQVAQGAVVYAQHCARCHGERLEGQPEWRLRKADGKLPAPPHNQEGHTYHHSDEVLFGITKQGLVPPYAPPGYLNDMPAFGQTLSDEEIWAVLAYIKSRWPPEALRYQEQRAQ